MRTLRLFSQPHRPAPQAVHDPSRRLARRYPQRSFHPPQRPHHPCRQGATMTDQRTSAIQYAHDNAGRFLDQLKELTSIPSISTNDSARAEIDRAAEWLANHLRELGMANVQEFQTPGHPVVFGEWMQAGQNALTALVYGHYDVQPADPLDLWSSGPFTPEVRGDYIYGRGCSDLEGQW